MESFIGWEYGNLTYENTSRTDMAQDATDKCLLLFGIAVTLGSLLAFSQWKFKQKAPTSFTVYLCLCVIIREPLYKFV
jgi:hypothetical protein